MPCYNAAATVEKAFRSVLNQTGVSIQLIAVDDGSTDNTAEILHRLAQEAPDNIHVEIVKHVKNRGMAGAFVTAFSIADARYFTQCDADDAILPNAIQKMFEVGISNSADIVAGIIKIHDGAGKYKKGFPSNPLELNSITINTPNFSNHSKLISLTALRKYGITPVEGIDRWEDLILMSKLLAHEPKIAFVNREVYEYTYDRRQPSLSRSRRELTLRDHIAGAKNVENYFISNGVLDKFKPFLNYLKFCAKVKLLRGKGKRVGEWKSVFPEANENIMSYKRISLLYRLGFSAINIMPTAISQTIFDITDRILYRK